MTIFVKAFMSYEVTGIQWRTGSLKSTLESQVLIYHLLLATFPAYSHAQVRIKGLEVSRPREKTLITKTRNHTCHKCTRDETV